MSMLLHELRHALRAILARPAFSALVVAVLGAGLACVVFMLAFLDGFVLRPLPFKQPGQLYQAGADDSSGWRDVQPVSGRDVVSIRRRLVDTAAVAAAARSSLNLSDLDRPERYNGAHVSANLFDVLDVAPILGRGFVPADEQPGAPTVAVLSHELWQSRYGSDRAIVGRGIRIDGRPATVVGVMPPDFSYPRREALWVAATLPPGAHADADDYQYWLVLRARPGVGREQLAGTFAGWFAAAAQREPERFRGLRARIEPLRSIVMDRTARAMLGKLFLAVLMVLLVACANAASLLLAQTIARQQELAVRVALGASRSRLLMHLFAQSLLLSIGSLALALPLAAAALRWQQQLLRESEFSLLWLHFDINREVILLACAAALLTAFCSGILPALRLSRAAPALGMQDGGLRSAGSIGVARASRVLVIVEIALSSALVICVGTLVRGVVAFQHADIGIDTGHLLTARVMLPGRAYPGADDQARLYERLGERLRADPGVVDASVGTALPGTYYNEMRDVLPAGTAVTQAALPQTGYAAVDDHFLAAFGVGLQEGRFFDRRDTADSARVAVVDRTFAERYGGGSSVLGRQFRLDPRDAHGATVTIIGIIGHVAFDRPGFVEPPALLVPLRQAPFKIASIAVRTHGDARGFAPRLAELMRGVDADTPLYWVRDYAAVLRDMSFDERAVAQNFELFGTVALLLAGAGLYGVMALSVGQRTREIGVRRALGASSWSVLRGLFARNAAQLALGLALGLAAGIPFARALSASLRTIEPGGWPVVAAALCVLAGAAALAVVVPARRALRVDPIAALRHE